MYDGNSIQRLEEKLDYEPWILNFLFEERDLFPSGDARAKIKGDKFEHIAAGVRSSLSQGRVNKIIQKLYPFIFTASYKALDMQMEWILEEHEVEGIIDSPDTFRSFDDKISDLKSLKETDSLKLPSIYEEDNSIYNRVFSLYDNLKDHRNTIIHGDNFEISKNKLEITDKNGTTYQFYGEKLFSFAEVSSITSELLGSGTIEAKKERELKTYLDYLAFIHEREEYGVTSPWSPIIEKKIEVENRETSKFRVNMEEVWKAFESFPDAEGFYLRIIRTQNQETITEWRIPNDELPEQGEIVLDREGDEWSEWRINQ